MPTILDLDSQRREVVLDSSSFSSSPSPLSNSSTSDGSEATYYNPGSSLGQLSYDMNQMLQLQNAQKPHLKIVHQPMDKFRFRYKSEMHGSHGSLMAATNDKSKKLYPTVQLCGFRGEAIIRCSLYQTDSDRPMPHSHKLVVRNGDEDREDPHDVIVSTSTGFHAEFRGMGIIHTAKKYIAEELFKKLKTCKEAERGADLTFRDEERLKDTATREEKNMNLNQVCLCFQAFVKDDTGQLKTLCEPVFSATINNMKSAQTGELKIVRMSSAASSVNGGDEVFLFVEKVNRKNIKVRFFEEDESGQCIWSAYGNFTEIDVHHQYGIVLTTPEYHKKDIRTQKDVKIQLERPSDGDRSDSLPFTYTPCLDIMAPRKRPRPNDSFNSTDIPMTVNQLEQMPRISVEYNIDETLNQLLNDADNDPILQELSISADFAKHFERNSDEYKIMYTDISMLDCAGPSNAALLCKDSQTPPKGHLITQGGWKEESYPPRVNRNNEATYEKILSLTRMYGSSAPFKMEQILHQLLTEPKKTGEGEDLLHWAIKQNGGKVKNILEIIHKFNLNDFLNNVNERGENCLHVACDLDKVEFIRPLINLGADPNARDINGNTPLHVAVAERRHMCMARILDRANYTSKSKELNINLSNHQSMTALHLAVKNQDLEAVKRLVEANASVKIAEYRHGNSILHIAVVEGAVDIVRFLLVKTRINVNQTNSAGYTPLQMACACTESADSKAIVKLLLEHKADPMMTNEHNIKISQDEELAAIEDEADMDRAKNSFELAQNKPEILAVLQEFHNMPLVEVKEEMVDIKTEPTSKSSLLDDICLAKICDIFNANGLWKQLAMVLEQSSQISICERSSNPTKTLFNAIEMHGSSLDDLMTAFDYLKVGNAITCLNEMIGRNYYQAM
ncbi:nuclear factor NF-kappa-B p110 subunit [Phlebotomus argentipes]|uniref:nuclear factor NF-kappa-B p110 subunit n=1 Tax=Phlebotomus argentipes TaxID=94469 RepID=UPI0028930BD0|nr:nuclear factor NF-kappa-B p110 subunit [Phlebotomus argentipes]